MANTLLSLVGLPRSGKSTLARKLGRYYGAPIVNADSIRLALHGQRYAAQAEPMVRAIRRVMVPALFGAGHQLVIYDETNFSRETRRAMRSPEWESFYIVVDTTPDVCIERAIATGQEDLIPVINEMHARYDDLDGTEQLADIPQDLETAAPATRPFFAYPNLVAFAK